MLEEAGFTSTARLLKAPLEREEREGLTLPGGVLQISAVSNRVAPRGGQSSWHCLKWLAELDSHSQSSQGARWSLEFIRSLKSGGGGHRRDGMADRFWCRLPWGWQVHVKFSCMRSDERLHSYLDIRIKGKKIRTLE